MNSPSVSTKFAALQEKTDRQLIEIVSKAQEHGLVFAKVARAHSLLGDRIEADRVRAQAERAYHESSALLPAIRGLRDEVAALERRLEELRTMLEGLSECPETVERIAACGC